ncbi:hypothetical protein IR148_03135 [Dysgonomonas mossii]|uniref:ATP-grasp domain-containing protein n=1 Tax=Dysgonomonas mossii TaxID=163665 RepID=A0A4Y9IQY3_9BACT|nr:hypothetical protein [Dysgonomonas mossii]MBF0760035.1 hypothetical protein [Dysgonomonas mossii]TFU90987.1 hypothetical protein E4T88_03135 [Dysgonomonas mossii]
MNIHYFNPGHETAVNNASPYYTPPANIAAMQEELSFLPAWYADREDKVLVDRKDEVYYSYLTEKFSTLAQPVSQNELTLYRDANVSLWGVSPQAIRYFEELNKELEINLDIPEWSEEYKYLNSRLAARDCLSELINSIPLLSQAVIPQFYTNLDDINRAVNASAYQLLAKAPYSSSGRGLLWLPATGLTRTENQILHGILKKQGSVSIERVLDKQMDFAMEFMADGKGNIAFAGYSLFYTNAKGGYEANYIGSQESIIEQLSEKISLDLLDSVKGKLINILSKKLTTLYNGCIGVDMLIYLEDNEYKLHPCVEINMRYNMGFLSCRLYENYIATQSCGKFYIDFNPKAEEMYNNHLLMEEKYPIRIENGKIISGYLSLCPINRSNRYRAYVLVEEGF